MKSHDGRSVILPEARIAEMVASGAWDDQILTDYFDHWVEVFPDKVAVRSISLDRGETRSLTFAELKRISERIAVAFRGLGLGLGDVVSFQLENRWEFLAIAIACVRIGAVTNPLMPVLRERELSYMLALSDSKLLITPKSFRGFDFKSMALKLHVRVPSLEHVLILDDVGEGSFDAAINADGILADAERPDPDDLMQLLFTSGTTGEPKGAMHTANTLFANVRECAARFAFDEDDVIFCPTPLAHQLGYLFGLLTPCMIGASVVYLDTWDPIQAADIIEREQVTFCMGATPFLNDLANLEGISDRDLSAFRLFVSGGAPIPSALVSRAKNNLSASILSVWGMTEVLAVTTVRLDDPEEKTAGTDGVATPNTAVRIVDRDGKPLESGQEGLLETSGATVCVGYMKRPELFKVRDDIWFDTGDLARMDADGYIRITGRSKDIIIRGGENIPVVEIEGILFRHKAISQVAIVAMPDERFGERACAYVQLNSGQTLTLGDISDFLTEAGVAKVYHPERLEIVDGMPMTATGKVQKFELRDRAKSLA